MSWLDETIMARKGLAKRQGGRELQPDGGPPGQISLRLWCFRGAGLRVDPGAVVSAENARDAFEGAIQSESDSPSQILNFPYLNRKTADLRQRCGERRLLAVLIKASCREDRSAGTTVIMPEFGGLVPTADTALLTPPFQERVRKLHVDAQTGVKWKRHITLPYEPFIGTIGTAPEMRRSPHSFGITMAATWTCRMLPGYGDLSAG